MRDLLYLRNALKKLKSDGEITANSTIVDWGGNEIAIGAHCDSGRGVMIKKGTKEKIGIRAFLRKKFNEGNKDDSYLGGPTS